MKTIIVGGGKVGFYLAKTLLEHDYEVTVIEREGAGFILFTGQAISFEVGDRLIFAKKN